MCGRYATSRTTDRLTDEFDAALGAAAQELEPDYNVAPTTLAPLVVGRADESGAVGRELLGATWGLVPSWAKDRSIGSRLINARVETVAEKPSFRRAFAARRALVPADGYYEWYQPAAVAGVTPRKQPFYLSRPGGLAFAGLYEFWRPREDPHAPWLITFTILTTAAEGADGRIHDRAPLLVEPAVRDAWLDPAVAGDPALLGLLLPATPGRLEAWPVSTAVNDVRHNGPELVRPLPEE